MDDLARFRDYIERIRAGDAAAAAQLVRDYEPAIRTEVRVRLRLLDPALKRLFDSMDVCQSVLASFFVRAAAHQYDLDEPANLIKILVTMARNKPLSRARRERRQRRDNRRVADADPDRVEGGGPTPSRVAAGRELLERVRGRLSEEERQIADLRAAGHNWPQIAQQLGGSAEARRKQFARALDRVVEELGIEEVDGES
jgi:RNA polymerase sigma-70 factor (ECF subfamily)